MKAGVLLLSPSVWFIAGRHAVLSDYPYQAVLGSGKQATALGKEMPEQS